MMSKSLAIAILSVFAFAYQAVATVALSPTSGPGDDRYFVSRLFDARQIVLNKNAEPTAFIFTAAPGDSIKVACEGHASWLGNDADKNTMYMKVKSAEGETSLLLHDLGKWIALPTQGGKVALILGHASFGERQIALKSLSLFRKSVENAVPPVGITSKILEVNNLALPKVAPASKTTATVFFLGLRDEDQYRVQAAGSLGTAHQTMVGYVFKTGEEFAKQPIAMGTPTALPANGKSNSLFGFGFSELPDSKGTNYYHIDIDRIPMGTAGQPSMQDR
jgi:hypothetical protein